MKGKKIELLAPAGSLEKLKWAIDYGADAVYLGGLDYSLRANAKNFTLAEIKKGVSYAHKKGAKVYVTINIVFREDDVKGLTSYMKKLDKIGCDAIIFSDPIIIDIAKENNLKIDLHLSTQASVLNKDACLYYLNKGVKRIVLARECSKSDIKNIIDKLDVEIECFIHGAMCTNFSGRCVLSNYFTKRDANRGGCCQVCRFNFYLYDNKENLISKDDDFSIASKDLSLVDYIKDMIDIGVRSFKLEGRMRSIYYVATIVSVYRKLIDMYMDGKMDENYVSKAKKILYRCANREVSSQFYKGFISYEDQYYTGRKEESNQDFLGIVLSYDSKRKEAKIEQRNFFKIKDSVTIFGPNVEDYSFKINKILDEDGNVLDAARHPRQIVIINCDKKVRKNDLLRINFFDL